MPNILGGDEVLELLKKRDTLPPSCGSGSLAYCCATAFDDWRAMIVRASKFRLHVATPKRGTCSCAIPLPAGVQRQA
ncbi:hypothetical protein [Aureliella helgolandensis]|uniref:hypothetical protein n=1 Tax=Aureliella helgolandensis TaxID=2527968 RepID=UPI00119D30F2|nr:hypothetical protein [Aureliella helgolandensis]